MPELAEVAPAFVEMAHRIVWCGVATTDTRGRPRTRVLHPVWVWDGSSLVGWVGTGPTPPKVAHLAAHPYASCHYWSPNHDTCVAECAAELLTDDETCTMVWNLLKDAPAPVGYDPAIIPVWTEPTADTFAALKLEPWHLRVFPGTMLLEGKGEILTWTRETTVRR